MTNSNSGPQPVARLKQLRAAHEVDPPMSTNCDICFLLAQLSLANERFRHYRDQLAEPTSPPRFDNETEACRHCPTPDVHPTRIGGILTYEGRCDPDTCEKHDHSEREAAAATPEGGLPMTQHTPSLGKCVCGTTTDEHRGECHFGWHKPDCSHTPSLGKPQPHFHGRPDDAVCVEEHEHLWTAGTGTPIAPGIPQSVCANPGCPGSATPEHCTACGYRDSHAPECQKQWAEPGTTSRAAVDRLIRMCQMLDARAPIRIQAEKAALARLDEGSDR